MSDIDLDEIRQAMDDEPYMGFTWASKWLLALCDEVERLRAENADLRAQFARLAGLDDIHAPPGHPAWKPDR